MDSAADTAATTSPAVGESRSPPHVQSCASCGCSLGGVPEDARCPQCGLSVAATRRSRLLRHAEADWRGQLYTGATLLAVAPAIAIGLIFLVLLWAGVGVLIGADSAATGSPSWVYSTAVVIATGLLARGWWLLTHDEPDAPVSTRTHVLGWVLRMTGIGVFAIVAIVWIIENALEWLGSAGGVGRLIAAVSRLPLGLLAAIHVVASMHFLSQMAARIPGAAMARRVRRFGWIAAVVGVGWIVLEASGLSPWVDSAARARGDLAWPVSLLNLVVPLALVAGSFWYWFCGIWLWKQLRALQRESVSPPAPDSDAPGPHAAASPTPPM